MLSDDTLLTAPEVGALIGKSGRTVARMAKTGALPFAQKIPGPTGAYLFRREDIARLQGEHAEAAVS